MSVEVYDFRSDNVGGIAPELLEALLERWLERALE
jgi:threonine aldolase